mmetsp:Transcript_29132/g.40995  ORF Transcript_29132/g.40995 Transcript_29132/m.40995 type:complete len:376 (+) Transcript_29132:290-1417(+)
MKFAIASVALLVGAVNAFTPSSNKMFGVRTKSSSLDMASGGSLNVKPIGVGSAAPKTVVTNVDLENVVETSDEWIQTRTGIAERHLLVDDEKIVDVSTEAAKNALDMSGLDPMDIDIVICACSSPEDLFGDATTIAANLGCKNAVAFDLVAACSGFLFGSVTAAQFLNNGQKNAIVIGSDALSRWTDWDDRNSCILFGDGAGAMVYTKSEEPALLGYSMHSKGESHGELMCMYSGTPRSIDTPGDGTVLSSGSYSKTTMNGKEVYKFATREVPRVVKEALVEADLTVDDVDWLLLHQANIRIMETVASRLKMPMDKVITNLSKYGNTSAASIPLAFDEAVRSGQVKKGDIIACSGFGAGLSWGSVIMRWEGEEKY